MISIGATLCTHALELVLFQVGEILMILSVAEVVEVGGGGEAGGEEVVGVEVGVEAVGEVAEVESVVEVVGGAGVEEAGVVGAGVGEEAEGVGGVGEEVIAVFKILLGMVDILWAWETVLTANSQITFKNFQVFNNQHFFMSFRSIWINFLFKSNNFFPRLLSHSTISFLIPN